MGSCSKKLNQLIVTTDGELLTLLLVQRSLHHSAAGTKILHHVKVTVNSRSIHGGITEFLLLEKLVANWSKLDAREKNGAPSPHGPSLSLSLSPSLLHDP